jgi:hypothetical protein
MDIRCPSCARLLVLRSGPAIRPHYAHRPRQSCRQRPGHPVVSPLRLEQLTLFELEPEPVYAGFEPGPALVPELMLMPVLVPEPVPVPVPRCARPAAKRRRRKAWLPRLLRRLSRRFR